MDSEYLNTRRIRLICSFLTNGGGTLKEMLEKVNVQLAEQGLNQIEVRTLQECISLLRKGLFQHTLRYDEKVDIGKLFKVPYKNKKYRWGEDTQYPQFGDLDHDERFTLPFLAGLLEQYRSIPAVQKILDRLPDIFNVGLEEMKSSYAIVHAGPTLYSDRDGNFQKKLIDCVIKILKHLHNGECIEYIYSPVNNSDRFDLTKVIPLQIRLYEHYYYLVAADLQKGNVRNYRVDRIHRLRVDPVEDKDGQLVLFDKAEQLKESKLKPYFKDSLGVWVHNNSSYKLHEVHIQFTAWAATYMKHLRFHSSQRIMKEEYSAIEDHATGEITEVLVLVISFQLRLANEQRPDQPATERNTELAFLLGRFREFAKVIALRPL